MTTAWGGVVICPGMPFPLPALQHVIGCSFDEEGTAT